MKLNKKIILSAGLILSLLLLIGIITSKGYSQSQNVRQVDIALISNFIIKDNPIKTSINEKIRLNNKKMEEARMIKNKEIAARIAKENKKLEEEDKIRKAKLEELEKAVEKKRQEELKSRKTAYLTFDDGPSSLVTEKILEILDEYDIKATFFVLGKMAEENPEVLKTIRDNGHAIGNHSYSHNYKYIYSNVDNFMADINKADQVLKNILGQEFQTNLIRLPGGSFENYKKKYVKVAEEEGYINYDWNALNGDAELPLKEKSQLIQRLKSTAGNRKELIVLMHDTDTKMNTVKALPEILDYLIDQAYVFETLENIGK